MIDWWQKLTEGTGKRPRCLTFEVHTGEPYFSENIATEAQKLESVGVTVVA